MAAAIEKLAAVAVVLAIPMAAGADVPLEKRRQSHVDIPRVEGAARDAEEIFQQRWNDAGSRARTRELLEKFVGKLDDEKLNALLQKWGQGSEKLDPEELKKRMLADPQLQALVKSFLEGRRLEDNLELDGVDRERLLKQYQELRKQAEEALNRDTRSGSPRVGSLQTGPVQDVRPPDQAARPALAPRFPADIADDSSLMRRMVDRMTDLVRKNEGVLGQSNAVQQALRKLSRARSTTVGLEESNLFRTPLGRLARSLPENLQLGKVDWQKLTTSALSRITPEQVPQMQVRSPNLPPVNLPRGVAGGGPPSRLGTALVWAAAGVLLVFVMVALRRQAAASAHSGGEKPWKLGPWPVSPRAVKTGRDLILAFEYVSLLHFGKQALSWNHREIADRLGEEDDGRHRPAAEHLALLYEQARYAPVEVPLAEHDLANARRELCSLAGLA